MPAFAVGLLAALLAACNDGGSADPASAAAAKPAAATVGTQRIQAIAAPAQGRWAPLKALPLVPSSAAHLPDGKLLLWSSDDKFGFGVTSGKTYFATYDPVTDAVTERTVAETGHDMFCTGTTNLADGRLLVNGGLSAPNTSLFDPASGTWTTGAAMNIPRGYQANTLLADGTVLTLGGSWSGGAGARDGEVWSAATGWRKLPGLGVGPLVYADKAGVYRGDNHMALLPTANGKVLHAGPSAALHWIDTKGNGAILDAGPRSDDQASQSGSVVMFEAGRILKAGGSPSYDNVNASNGAYLIDTTAGLSVRKLAPMAYARAFQNAVVLPNGQVMVIGGQTYPVPFSDATSVLVPELWDPATETFTPLPAMAAPRNYHSVALLLPDGRVLSGGGGLCGAGCGANHADVQIFTPHYLLNPDGTPARRPAITAAPATVQYGQVASVTTDSAVASFVLIRLSSTTHTVNNDQRRLSLAFRSTGANTWAVDMPTNPGLALPGDWMLFALNADGTPSVARVLRISLAGAPQIASVDDLSTTVGAAGTVQPVVTLPAGAAASYSASGLPPGIGVDAATGRLQGTATQAGNYRVTFTATAGTVRTSTEFNWSVAVPGRTRYVRLEALSEVAGNPWASAAEVNLLGTDGKPLPRAGWKVVADSQETAADNNAAANAIDGNPATIWHTQWSAASPAMPHTLTIDMGAPQDVAALAYLPRQDASTNGTIAGYRVWFSADGVNWGNPVASGNFGDIASGPAEKTVFIANLARSKPAAQSSTYADAGPQRAVDGVLNGDYAAASVAHTGLDANAWWEVDLGASHALSLVRLWNRSDCCADRLSNFYLLVSDTPMQGRTLAQLLADATVWRSQVAGTAGRTTLVNATGATGRYLRVQLAGTNHLQLAEVEALGVPATNRPPVLATPAATSSEQGVAASLKLTASDPDGDILTYAASGLPAGLTIGPGTGLISGTPTVAGSFPVTVTASDGRGGSTAVLFTWTVTAALPQIQPVPVAPATAGTAVNFSADTAVAGALSWQWNFGDGSAPTAWSPAATASHVFAQPGVYNVTVSARTADGRVVTRSVWQAVQGAVAGPGGRSSSQLAVEPRGTAAPRVWVVNPDNDSVSVFDSAMKTRIAEIPVGSQPRSLALAPDGRVWVANKGSASLSIVNPATLAVVQTVALPRASMPYGVVVGPAGTAWVALEALGRVQAVAANGTLGASASVGAHVRHLALTPAGTQLLVSRFITPPLPGEGTAAVQTSVAGVPKGGEVLVLDAATLAVQRSIVLQHSDKPDTTAQGRGIPNHLGAPAIAPDGRSAWVPGKQDNVQRGLLRDGQNLDFQNTVRAITSRIDLSTQAEDLAARIDHDNSGQASAALFHPGGAYLFVALQASRHLFRVDAGRAPQALALSPDGLTLYVHNFMDRTVGVHDLTRLLRFGEPALPLVATMGSVASDKLAAAVLKGKQLFYDARDPRLARDAYIACAGCHDDGGHDGRTWDFTGFGEGLRNTISLRGRGGAQGRLHWSGNFDEVQDFEGQIRTLAQGSGLMADAAFATGTRSQPLGDRKAGLSADLDALAAYVASLSSFDGSPWRTASGGLTASALAGRSVFAARCATCHGGPDFTDSAGGVLRDIGTLKPSSGKRLGAALTGIDTPTLRDAWATAPYLHDGSAPTIEAAIGAHGGLALNATDLANVASFVRQIGREENAVTPAVAPGTLVGAPVKLVAAHSAKCLDVAGGATTGGARVVQWTCNGAASQRWQKVAAAAGTQWRNAGSGLCLAVEGAATTNLARLVQVACNGAALSQVWAWNGNALVVQHDRLCADITGGATADGVQAIQYGCHGGPNQRFSEQ